MASEIVTVAEICFRFRKAKINGVIIAILKQAQNKFISPQWGYH